VALTVSLAEKLSLAATTLAPAAASTCPTNTVRAGAGRPKAHRQVLTPVLATKMRMGSSQNTSIALATYDVL
jgi:hypothetical protein